MYLELKQKQQENWQKNLQNKISKKLDKIQKYMIKFDSIKKDKNNNKF